ncbi:MAG: helix-turn-helix domain-containing protein [Candidatus Acetothermia bacterium]|jgi:DNA-binding XRE family transcriptional regulator|nr:helix-turn-helix domain-containing protein [Candidatus Acetothermia bacterium]MDH7506014.1 helix-turn-helix transcriptional regulator [Candidatus Acetothermia bacterium]
MARAITYVKDAERMITRARLTRQGIFVRFADDQEGLIPLEELELGAEPREIQLPSPYLLEVHLKDGRREELPWDYMRAFVDPGYRARAQEEGRRGRQLLGERLKRLRGEAGLSQEALAAKSGLSRVTIARLEAGEQDPHYETLLALARGLGLPLERLLVD